MNRYRKLRERQENEMNSFPMVFVFNDEQFVRGMHELGLDENDTDKVYSIGGGGLIRKTDSKAYNEMFSRFDKEIKSEIESDSTGEGFIKDMFLYELGNHEYGYTFDIEPTLCALGLTLENVKSSPTLTNGLQIAKKEYLESYM